MSTLPLKTVAERTSEAEDLAAMHSAEESSGGDDEPLGGLPLSAAVAARLAQGYGKEESTYPGLYHSVTPKDVAEAWVASPAHPYALTHMWTDLTQIVERPRTNDDRPELGRTLGKRPAVLDGSHPCGVGMEELLAPSATFVSNPGLPLFSPFGNPAGLDLDSTMWGAGSASDAVTASAAATPSEAALPALSSAVKELGAPVRWEWEAIDRWHVLNNLVPPDESVKDRVSDGLDFVEYMEEMLGDAKRDGLEEPPWPRPIAPGAPSKGECWRALIAQYGGGGAATTRRDFLAGASAGDDAAADEPAWARAWCEVEVVLLMSEHETTRDSLPTPSRTDEVELLRGNAGDVLHHVTLCEFMCDRFSTFGAPALSASAAPAGPDGRQYRYYEIELVGRKVPRAPQFGFAAETFPRSDTYSGSGCGDPLADDSGVKHLHSWGIDGARCCMWGHTYSTEAGPSSGVGELTKGIATSSEYTDNWRAGDTVCMVLWESGVHADDAVSSGPGSTLWFFSAAINGQWSADPEEDIVAVFHPDWSPETFFPCFTSVGSIPHRYNVDGRAAAFKFAPPPCVDVRVAVFDRAVQRDAAFLPSAAHASLSPPSRPASSKGAGFSTGTTKRRKVAPGTGGRKVVRKKKKKKRAGRRIVKVKGASGGRGSLLDSIRDGSPRRLQKTKKNDLGLSSTESGAAADAGAASKTAEAEAVPALARPASVDVEEEAAVASVWQSFKLRPDEWIARVSAYLTPKAHGAIARPTTTR